MKNVSQSLTGYFSVEIQFNGNVENKSIINTHKGLGRAEVVQSVPVMDNLKASSPNICFLIRRKH
jgi:hypothetical protein